MTARAAVGTASLCAVVVAACAREKPAPSTPTAPDVVTAASPTAPSCQTTLSYWQTLLSDSTRFCASTRDSDLPSTTPIRLITNSWFLALPAVPQLFPDTQMSINFDLLGWRVTNTCGPRGPEIQVNLRTTFIVDLADGRHYPLFTLEGPYAIPTAASFDPHHPWSFGSSPTEAGLCNAPLRIAQTYIGVFPAESVSIYICWLSGGPSCADRPPFTPALPLTAYAGRSNVEDRPHWTNALRGTR